jgi:hypothetical protein
MELTITRHAIDRFLERCAKLGMKLPEDIEGFIHKLVKRATPEPLEPGHKVRRIFNHNANAQYLVAEGWRFVLSENGNMVLTIERVRPDQN